MIPLIVEEKLIYIYIYKNKEICRRALKPRHRKRLVESYAAKAEKVCVETRKIKSTNLARRDATQVLTFVSVGNRVPIGHITVARS